MSAPAQLRLMEPCPRCGRPMRPLGPRARGLLGTMQFIVGMTRACGRVPAGNAEDARLALRELAADEPGQAAALACHAGACAPSRRSP